MLGSERARNAGGGGRRSACPAQASIARRRQPPIHGGHQVACCALLRMSPSLLVLATSMAGEVPRAVDQTRLRFLARENRVPY